MSQPLDAIHWQEWTKRLARRCLTMMPVRAGMLRWHAGMDEFPVEAFRKLEAAEKSASSDSVFSSRVIPSAPPSLADIRRVNRKMSILSYVVERGTVHGLVITPSSGAIKSVGTSRTVMKYVREHAASLRVGAESEARSSHVAGNELRKSLIDPFTQQLSGHGWYLVLGPRELREFMFTTFPEQAKGLRWLAEIRTVALLDSAARINVTTAILDLSACKGRTSGVRKPICAGGVAFEDRRQRRRC